MKILMCAGHLNISPGGDSADEKRLTRLITPRVALHCTARGADTDIVTPNPDGSITISLTGRAMKVVEINQQQRVDIYLEIHANFAPTRGCFVVYPDWSEDDDTDTHVRDVLGPQIAKAIKASTEIPVLGNGTLSEKNTHVGGQGSRLAAFKFTRNIKRTCHRMIIEVGAFNLSADLTILNRPDTPDKIGRAIAGALVPNATTPAAWGTRAPFNRDFGIPLKWCEAQVAEGSLGGATSNEFSHAGKTWQLFDNGAISFTQAAGATIHRPAPADVVQAASA